MSSNDIEGTSSLRQRKKGKKASTAKTEEQEMIQSSEEGGSFMPTPFVMGDISSSKPAEIAISALSKE